MCPAELQRGLAARLLPLVGTQLFLHAGMAGIRMGAPLFVLQRGGSAWAAGGLLALFAAAPVLFALPAGRMVDRHGYHRPVAIAAMACVAVGVLAALAIALPGTSRNVLLCLAAMSVGAGANLGLITIQRSAGRLARGSTELKQVFSWLGLAPALSNMVGPVLAGVLIDAAGYGTAFAVLAALPVAAWVWSRRVPRDALMQPRPAQTGGRRRAGSWDLLAGAPMRRLLLVNWLLSSSWDVHSFAVPLLGHERGLTASAIGAVLGLFALAVAGVRLLVVWWAHRLREAVVLTGAMLLTACVFAVYPLARATPSMGACAVLLGMALGAVQPMVMSTLHQITPDARHGEAIALRSMAINFSSCLMPLGFGLVGGRFGAASLFWLMACLLAVGSLAARQLGRRC